MQDSDSLSYKVVEKLQNASYGTAKYVRWYKELSILLLEMYCFSWEELRNLYQRLALLLTLLPYPHI